MVIICPYVAFILFSARGAHPCAFHSKRSDQKQMSKLSNSLGFLVLLGAVLALEPMAATAKEGASQLGKKRVKVEPVAAPCVEKGMATAWAGLTLSPWKVTTPTGAVWTMSFDDKGKVTYDMGAGQVIGIYTQPLAIYDSNRQLVLQSQTMIDLVSPYVIPYSDCTMAWYTDQGIMFMQRT